MIDISAPAGTVEGNANEITYYAFNLSSRYVKYEDRWSLRRRDSLGLVKIRTMTQAINIFDIVKATTPARWYGVANIDTDGRQRPIAAEREPVMTIRPPCMLWPHASVALMSPHFEENDTHFIDAGHKEGTDIY